ncbi:hypothetical protein BJX96DRAFT_159389 [Aspergillus floccosus]
MQDAKRHRQCKSLLGQRHRRLTTGARTRLSGDHHISFFFVVFFLLLWWSGINGYSW